MFIGHEHIFTAFDDFDADKLMILDHALHGIRTMGRLCAGNVFAVVLLGRVRCRLERRLGTANRDDILFHRLHIIVSVVIVMLFYAENMLRSRTTGGDTFVEEDTVLIQVGHIAAQFAYAVQVRDGVVVPIQRTGMRIAACAASRRNHCRRQLKRVERTFVDLCHRFGVTSKVIVNALFDHLIVTVDGRLQHFRIAIDLRGEFFNRIRLHNPARVDFSLIILRPAISVGRNRPAHPNGC